MSEVKDKLQENFIKNQIAYIRKAFKNYFTDVEVHHSHFAKYLIKIVVNNLNMDDFDEIKKIANSINLTISDITIYPINRDEILLQLWLD